MSSLIPWQDAIAILNAANLSLRGTVLTRQESNVNFVQPEPPFMFLSVEMAGESLAPVELGPTHSVWEETGQLYVHVVVPSGTGSEDSRSMAKQIAELFRGLPPRDVVWRRAMIGLGATSDDDGSWWSLTVGIEYSYQDIRTD